MTLRAKPFLAMVIATTLACGGGGGGSPTQPPVAVTPGPTPNPTPAPTPTPAATPTPLPTDNPGLAACPLGKGDVDASCSRDSSRLLSDVDAAIDRLVQRRPELFNTSDVSAAREYRVLDGAQYLNGVVSELRTAGFCADRLNEEVEVKSSNSFSERFDILLSRGYIRRGVGSYISTCSPAAFPLVAEDLIYRVFVFVEGVGCGDGRPVPPNSALQIPLGCRMTVTATPKDKNGKDVPPLIHGPEIAWDVPVGPERIRLEEFPGVPFNKNLFALEVGEFHVCANVKGVAGCLLGEVIP